MVNGGETLAERVLLVEGVDDKQVVRQLWRASSNMPDFTIIDKEGAPNLLKSIRDEVLAEDREAVGILIDANDDLNARWRSVAGRLRDAGIQLPNAPAPNGTIIEGNPIEGNPRVGVWLMPDNTSPGELEDFVERMIPPKDAVWPLSQAYIDRIPKADRKFTEGKILRAKVHAWLAARERPRLMGSAVGAGDLDSNVEVSKRFVRWLQELFA